MNIESLFEQPALRRYWLFSKALESVPFAQALEVARAADEFLTGAAPSFSLPNLQGAVRPSPAAENLASQVDVTIPETRRGWEDSLSAPAGPTIVSDDGGHVLDSAAGKTTRPTTALETAPAGLADPPADGAPADADDPPHGEVLLALAEAGLTTLASTDDVVRYLRQRDDVVVRAEDGIFLVNARLRMKAGELVARANRMRARDRKPAFQLTPLWFATSADTAVADQSVAAE
jgi:hypothetical protein